MRKIIRREGTLVFLALVVCLAQMLAMVMSERAKGDLIDLILAGDFGNLARVFAIFLVLMGLMVLFAYLYTILRRIIVQRLAYSMRDEFFKGFLRLEIKDMLAMEEGDLLNKYTKELNQIETSFFLQLTVAGEMALKIIFIVGAFLLVDWKLAIFSLLIMSAPILVPRYFEASLEGTALKLRDEIQDHMGKFISWLNTFELVKNFSIEDKIGEIYDTSNSRYRDISFDLEDLKARNVGMSFLLSQGAQALIIVFTGFLVLRGALSPGDFVMISGLVSSLKVPTYWISTLYQNIISTRPVRQSVEGFLTHDPDKDQKKADLPQGPLSASFEDVDYSYMTGEPILKGLNLEFEAGKKYLISGKSGSGKTTAMNLLLSYDSPDSGRICLGGQDIEDLGSVRDYVTVARQDASLFDDSLRNNVAMFDEGVSDQAISRVLTGLGLDQGKNYQSLDDHVSERGENFSGGEKKRISLARAFLKDCGLLILDEPLANIDPDNMDKVEDLILSIEDKTLVIISHQFNEDRLVEFDGHYVFEGGRAYEKVH